MAFTQNFRRIIVLLIGGSMISCSAYRTFEIEVLQPAQIPLESGKRIGLLERNMLYDTDPLKFAAQDKNISKMSLFELFTLGMKEVFAEAYTADSLLLLTEKAPVVIARPLLPPPFPADSIRGLCQEFDLDYIVSIELSFYDRIEGNVTCNWLVRLYSATTPEPLDSVILKNESGSVYDYEDLAYGIQDAAWNQGGEYARRITPHWKLSERRIYNKGKVFQLGDAFFREGNTTQALKVWEGAWNVSTRMAVKAGINLGWVYENTGDFDGAIDILTQTRKKANEKGMQNGDTEYLQRYLKLLNQRREENQLLEQQLAPVNE